MAADVVPVFTIESVLAGLKKLHPEASAVDDGLPAGIKAWENVTYGRRGEKNLQLDLYRREDGALLPAVLMVHGGGWIAGDRTMERPFAKNLAKHGYVAVPVSYRLGTAGRFPAPVNDLKEAVRWLRAHATEYGVDAAHIGIVGGSAGGTLATMLGVTGGLKQFETEGEFHDQSSTVQAVVDIDGTVTFMNNALIESSETIPSPYWEYLHGIYSSNREIWLAASPLYYVSRRSAPTLFINSTATQPVLVGREEMCARLKLLGVDSKLIEFPDTPHPFWLVHPWFERAVAETDAFLKTHLNSQ